MENKLRGQKHRQNKQRFNDKSKVVSKAVGTDGNASSKYVQKLDCNWDRYDESPNDTMDAEQSGLTRATNYSLLSQMPISQGGHFQFKCDKNLENEYDFEILQNSKLFSLDLNTLAYSINTIPFHERCDIDMSYLKESQIKFYEKEGKQNKTQYECFLKSSSILESKHKIDKQQTTNLLMGQQIALEAEEDSLCQRLSTHTDQENLEQWLDDVLNL